MSKHSDRSVEEAWNAQIPKDMVVLGDPVFLGLSTDPESVILPGVSFVVQGRPQLPFRPTRLFVDPSCATWFDVTEIRIGTMSKMAAIGSIPASAFALRSIDDEIVTPGVSLHWQTILPGQEINMIVRNLHTSRALRFRAALEGVIARG